MFLKYFINIPLIIKLRNILKEVICLNEFKYFFQIINILILLVLVIGKIYDINI